MSRLSKRWEPMKLSPAGSRCYRTFLSALKITSDEPLAWGCIETYGRERVGPYKLEIWNTAEGEWEYVCDFDSIKKAKAIGRVLAAAAMGKNF